MSIIALHGFLGLPSDWDYWPQFNPYMIQPSKSLITWAEEFNRWAKIHTKAPRLLIGYSMGGRLALHALIENPDLWDKATLISTNIGLKDPGTRLQNDYAWAAKFRTDPWEKLMEEWESQSLFKDSFKPNRLEKDFNRENLALYLENFSLAKQKYLLEDIVKLNVPIHWITGSCDQTAESHAKEVTSLHRQSTHLSIPNRTHRVHFEFPEVLIQKPLQKLD